MKRKVFLLTALLFICTTVLYLKTYPLDLNMTTLEQITSAYVNRGVTAESDVKYLGSGVTFHKKEFYLVRVNGEFGYVSFEEGPFGRHRFRHVSWEDTSFRNGIIESGGKKYLLFSGVDFSRKIDKIIVEIQGFSYELIPGKSRPFIVFCEVNESIPSGLVSMENCFFYDAAGANITADVRASCGMIQYQRW